MYFDENYRIKLNDSLESDRLNETECKCKPLHHIFITENLLVHELAEGCYLLHARQVQN